MPELKTNVLYYGAKGAHNLARRIAGPSWTTIRRRVLDRDGYQCQICGDVFPLAFDGALFVHHKIPKAQGGTDDPDNLVTLCDLCHGGVLHRYGKWLGVPSMSQAEQQEAKIALLSTRDDYQWFLRLPREEFLRVQEDVWSEWGVEKRPARRWRPCQN